MSLQFWARIQENAADAWQTYMDYTRPGGSKTFVELIAGAGLESPFGDTCLKEVCEAANKWLQEYDLTGIE